MSEYLCYHILVKNAIALSLLGEQSKHERELYH